jgi:hypothetical protein
MAKAYVMPYDDDKEISPTEVDEMTPTAEIEEDKWLPEVEKVKNEARKRQVLRGNSHIFLASKLSIVMSIVPLRGLSPAQGKSVWA